MERSFCVFKNPQTGLYAFSANPWGDVASKDCTRLEAIRLCETLNVGLGGWQRVLAVESHEARKAA